MSLWIIHQPSGIRNCFGHSGRRHSCKNSHYVWCLGYGYFNFSKIVSSYIAFFATLQFRRNAIKFEGSFKEILRISLVLGWIGMRGVVSLAAALAIPHHLESGQAFPERNLILFVTFVVILLSLIIQVEKPAKLTT